MKALAAAVLAVAVAGFGIVGSAAGAARRATAHSVTFHLVENQTGFNLMDNPPRQGFNAAPLMGDEFAISADVQTRAGKHAGSLDATCMITHGGNNGSGPCYGVYSFKGGEIFGITRVRFSSNTTRIVVVGGTGAYAGASGEIVSVSRGQNSPYSDDTFNLTLP